MGYTTDFWGEFAVTPPLKPEHVAYLKAFATTRRVKRDEKKAERLPDPIRKAAGLPIGPEGSYFVGNDADDNIFATREERDSSILDNNSPPGQVTREVTVTAKESEYFGKPNPWTRNTPYTETQEWAQPGLWCQWEPNEDGTAIRWDDGEKFYEYTDWIKYLIVHFLAPWGYTVNGEVTWHGEDYDDVGKIQIKNNEVHELFAVMSYR